MKNRSPVQNPVTTTSGWIFYHDFQRLLDYHSKLGAYRMDQTKWMRKMIWCTVNYVLHSVYFKFFARDYRDQAHKLYHLSIIKMKTNYAIYFVKIYPCSLLPFAMLQKKLPSSGGSEIFWSSSIRYKFFFTVYGIPNK